ncbi:MAG: hypothetical protein J1E85_05910 [Ruminococcus sp.]|nr:hypothetical protein [Ruminococcus sp.]
MDFTKYNCPVCNEQFQKDEDIVVCPECGTPHHRVCYESLNQCFYQDKHKEGFLFEEAYNDAVENDDNDNTTVTCPRCNEVNPKEIFYCQNCGLPLGNQNENNKYTNNSQQNGQYGQQNGMPPFGVGFNFDPMAGIDSNEPIAENVTAGEMSKFVGKNTPYFLMVFKRLKNLNISRFNFSAFLFSGAYFFYRKMIGLGFLFSALIIGLYVASYYVCLTPAYQEIYQIIAQNSQPSFLSLLSINTSVLSTEQIILYNLPNIFSIFIFALRIVSGAIANRFYYKHCGKIIRGIKAEESTEPVNERLELKGGVNIASAICIGVLHLAIIYIPYFISM